MFLAAVLLILKIACLLVAVFITSLFWVGHPPKDATQFFWTLFAHAVGVVGFVTLQWLI